MANIKSQIKRNKQNAVARERNKAVRSRTRTMVKRFETALESGDEAVARDAYQQATSAIDRAASKGVMHKNTASRTKSRLAKRLAKL